MLKTKIVVFEGGDCCGKTSLLNATSDALENKGFKVGKFKFPAYTDMCGEEILNHLKNWKYSEKDKEASFKELMKFSELQYLNKLAAFKEFYDYAKGLDYVLVDRFTLSQYVYDLAWAEVIDKDQINQNIKDNRICMAPIDLYYGCYYTKEVIDVIKERASTIAKAYSEAFPNFYTFVIYPNDLVKVISMSDSNRRMDEYDKNKEYQDEVNRLMRVIVGNNVGNKAFVINSEEMIKNIIRESKDYLDPLDFTLCKKIDDRCNKIKYEFHKNEWLAVLKEYTELAVQFIVEGVTSDD